MIRWALVALLAIAMWIAPPRWPAGASGDNPVTQVKRWLWPRAYPPPMPGIGTGSPGETLEPPAEPAPLPKAAPKRKSEPVPKAKAKKVRRNDDDDDRPPRRTAAPPPVPCDQIQMGMATVGPATVRAAARQRGYSDAQINAALRACGY